MRSRIAVLCLIGMCLLGFSSARAADTGDYLRSYPPLSVTVNTTDTLLLAPDKELLTVQLTNLGTHAVWVCEAKQTPEVGKGFWLPAGGSVTFSDKSVPKTGLRAIADGEAVTVAVGRG